MILPQYLISLTTKRERESEIYEHGDDDDEEERLSFVMDFEGKDDEIVDWMDGREF